MTFNELLGDLFKRASGPVKKAKYIEIDEEKRGKPMLTVEVQTDGGAAFPEFVLGRHLVLASVLYSDVHQRHRHVVRVLILLDNHLQRGREGRVVMGVV